MFKWNNKKRMLAISMAALAVTGVAGIQAASAKITTLTFLTWTVDADSLKSHQKVFNQFEKENPGVKVKVINPGEGSTVGYVSKLLTMAAGNSAPDVVVTHFWGLPKLAESGVIMDLSSFIARDKSVKPQAWADAGIKSASWKGKLWALPFHGSPWWISFNRKIFAQSGLVDPVALYEQKDWTWDSMINAAQKTTKYSADGTKITRVGFFQSSDFVGASPWILGAGGDLFNNDGTKCLIDSDQSRAGLSKIQDLMNNKRILAMEGLGSIDLTQGAKQEKWAMCAWWQTVTSHFAYNKITWPVDQVPFPSGPVDKRTNVTWVHSVGITKQSKHKDLAWKLIKLLTNKENSIMFAQDLQYYTTRKDAQDGFRQALLSKGITGSKFLEDALDRMNFSGRTTQLGTVLPKVDAELSRIWTKKIDVPTATKEIARYANAMMAAKKK